MEKRNYGSAKRKSSDKRNQESTDVRSARSADFGKYGDTDTRTFNGELKPLMTEEEKKDAQVLELSYDFSCRIIRLYKYLNEGKLSKADRDIVDALGRQLLRSATSIDARGQVNGICLN